MLTILLNDVRICTNVKRAGQREVSVSNSLPQHSCRCGDRRYASRPALKKQERSATKATRRGKKSKLSAPLMRWVLEPYPLNEPISAQQCHQDGTRRDPAAENRRFAAQF